MVLGKGGSDVAATLWSAPTASLAAFICEAIKISELWVGYFLAWRSDCMADDGGEAVYAGRGRFGRQSPSERVSSDRGSSFHFSTTKSWHR
jgi:hypothetical protein